MTGSATQSLLEQIPASSIDRVEIITSPTAKYDPEGVAGILNIILKKDKLEGKNGQVSVTWGTERKPQRIIQWQHPGSAIELLHECRVEPAQWIPQRKQHSRTSLWRRPGGRYDSLSVLTSSSMSDNLRSSWNFKTALTGRPHRKPRGTSACAPTKAAVPGIEDVVNLETWSTDALGGFTRYGLSVATMHPRTWTWGTSTSTRNAMCFKPLPAGPSAAPRTTPVAGLAHPPFGPSLSSPMPT